ncbi:tRNA (N(6)-L-threonylcarbamoyladenosine(37)-C(2))-methylthiotransferase MtaB [Desulfobacterota bacterium AH_259_B03_O07]|nr:tRNA (N(6)-L-threonylcarbamoyladenosine(37)-C(2))-methylthiotransferase MtaB [Desulfobacterota bacterium AH_259_B03_O07]
MKKKISVVTLGCKVNQYDTAALLNRLPESKYKRVPFSEPADVYVIDTCTVTHKADSEARNYVYRANRSNPKGIVVVTGCYAQVSSQELKELEGVDYIVGNSHKFSSLLNIIREGESQLEPKVIVSDIFNEKKRRFESPEINYFPERTRAFLKVQDGCNYSCSFCIIPLARGRSRSLSINEVLNRMEILSNSGYKEVVLTGIHLASYGRDVGTNLLNLLIEVEKSNIMNWIRLSSLDPADTSDELIDFVASSKTICPSFHIALQSGDKDVLKRMRRRYNPEGFIYSTNLIRERIQDAAIGTDVMVGFPGETEKEFENTRKLLKQSPLTYYHVFPYSKRRGTTASNMPDQVPPEVTKLRSKILRDQGVEKKRQFYRRFIGKEVPVIVETGLKATSRNYISVQIVDGNLKVGDEARVEIRRIEGEVALGLANLH